MSRLKVKKFIRHGEADFPLLALVTILVLFGVVMVLSASSYVSLNKFGTPYYFFIKNIIFAVTGAVIMGICTTIDYHFWRSASPLLLGISIILLLLTLTKLGSSEGGATRALYLFGFTVMPGEIIKLTGAMFAATFLAKEKDIILSFKRGILPMVIFTGFVAALIILQPNLSTALTFCGIMAGMMFIAGLEYKYVIGAVILGGAGLGGIVLLGDQLGFSHWKKRIVGCWTPFDDPLGRFYQVCQGLLALGSGGLTGVGFGKSVQKTMYLPESHNDFILAIIGEELGLIGVVCLIAVYVLLIWRCAIVCIHAEDRFGRYLGGGITIMLGLQVIFNIAVVTSSMPPTGVILPFVSYGGNALWVFMAAMGIMLSISKKKK